jgi:hypothetical protein
MPPNPLEFGNPGWNPYGLSDTTHSWWNIEGGQVTRFDHRLGLAQR